MAVNSSWTGYETWARVFLFSESARCYDAEPTKNCTYLCYRSIATKWEMIRFTVIPLDMSHFFNNIHYMTSILY